MTRDEYIGQFENRTLRSEYERIIAYEDKYFIPAVRFDTAMFLMQTSSMLQPRNVLEIGFGSGASSVFIRNGLHNCASAAGYRITSLERDNNRFVRGQALLAQLCISDIDLIKCDAFDYLHNCDKDIMFDYVFLDAVKRDYADYLPLIKSHLASSGVLIADNTFFNDKVLLRPEELEQKYRCGVGLLDEFNRILSLDEDFTVMMYNIGDGMTLAMKK